MFFPCGFNPRDGTKQPDPKLLVYHSIPGTPATEHGYICIYIFIYIDISIYVSIDLSNYLSFCFPIYIIYLHKDTHLGKVHVRIYLCKKRQGYEFHGLWLHGSNSQACSCLMFLRIAYKNAPACHCTCCERMVRPVCVLAGVCDRLCGLGPRIAGPCMTVTMRACVRQQTGTHAWRMVAC